MADIILHTDGGARGNPGPAGAGVVIEDSSSRPVKSFSKFLGVQTNNWAEYEAVFLGLSELKKLYGPKVKAMKIEVMLDSELIARQLLGEYQIKEPTLYPQFIKVHNLLVKDLPNVSFLNVAREKNSGADNLANEAMDKGK